jgi:protein-tyrosine kinase
MSRNLEILEQVHQDQELFRVYPVTQQAPVSCESAASRPAISDNNGFQHEELLGLAQRLFLAGDSQAEGRMRQVVFCGIDVADGTGALCAELGRILASQVSAHVCVVDANVRAPALHRLLRIERSNGEASPQAATQPELLQKVAGNLWLISGHLAATNGGVTASLEQVRCHIKDLPAEFAYVVISAPPVGLYNDAALLGQRAEGVVLVLEANSTRRVAARKAKQALEAANVRVLGTVLNNRTFPIPEKIYRLL